MTGLPIVTSRLVHIYRSEGHDVAALSGVDLDVAAGEMVGLLGPSGAGKSTLLTLFGGLLRPSAGRIRIGDARAVRGGRARARRACAPREVSLVLQGAARNLLPYLTPARTSRSPSAAARAARQGPARRTADGARPGRPRRRGRHAPLGAADARASSSSPRSRSRWPPGPGCCSPTSRPASSTTRPATRARRRSTDVNREVGTTVVAGHPRPRGRRPAAADGHHPRRPGGWRGPTRRGVRGGRPPTGRCRCRTTSLERPAARHAGARPPRATARYTLLAERGASAAGGSAQRPGAAT